MAEKQDTDGSVLEEIKSNAPELYAEMEAEALRRGVPVSEVYAGDSGYSERYTEIKAAKAMEAAANAEMAGKVPEQGAAPEAGAAPAEENAAAPEDAETPPPAASEEMITDPFHWESFYAPAPEEELKRFNDACGLLSDDEGEKYQESESWKAGGIRVTDTDDRALNQTLDLCACRRLASSNDPVTIDNLREAREAERIRIETEYYNSVYALWKGDEYSGIKAETHIARVMDIQEAVRQGKSEEEIFRMLDIRPKKDEPASRFEDIKRMARLTTASANLQPIRDFAESRKKFNRGMHNLGKVLDGIQKFEQKNPVFGSGLNFALAGNPVYVGYRSILSARALYNDVQGFKDYAVFRDLYKNQTAESGLKYWKEQNPESKIGQHDYNQAKAYGDYASYLARHKSNHISEDEFNRLKKFQKESEFNREDFETARMFAGKSYEEYKQYIQQQIEENKGKKKKKDIKAVSEAVFKSVAEYTGVRRTLDYAEYKKNMGERAISEADYNRIKAMSKTVGKVSIKDVFKDKTTRDAMAAHSVIFFRSVPVVGQAYALGFAVKNMASKSYWRGLKGKAIGTRDAVKKLVQAKGRDKEAWKELYSNGSGLIAEAAGAWMLYNGVSNGVSNIGSVPEASAAPINESMQSMQAEASMQTVVNTPEYTAALDSLSHEEIRSMQADLAARTDTPSMPRDNTAFMTGMRPLDLDVRTPADSTVLQTEAGILQDTATRDSTLNNMENPAFQNPFTTEGFAWKPEGLDPGAADIEIPFAPEAPVQEFVLNDEQKANLSSLFEQYPRAATAILEGNLNPEVSDVTKGGFSIEGEGNLYRSGVISSATLQELLDSGKLSNEQIENLSKFADANFDNGKMNAELRSELYGRETPVAETRTPGDDRGDTSAPQAESGDKEEPAPATPVAENEGDVRAYYFAEDGSVIYRPEHLGDLQGLQPEELDARIYQDLLARQAAGEELDAGALKFLDGYAAAHPENAGQEESKVPPEDTRDRQESDQQPAETELDGKIAEDNGFEFTRRDLEGGGYEMTGSGELNGKATDVKFVYDENDKMLSAEYAISQGGDDKTIISGELDSRGQVRTQVTEIDGDRETTRRGGDMQDVLKEALAREISGETEGKETDGLEESRKIVLGNHEDESQAEPDQTDKVRSSTFRGKYWLEENPNGDPVVRMQMSERELSTIQADPQLVDAFQSTITGEGHNFEALGGALHSDNYGGENRDNPAASGIMIQCENLARTVALNEAVYQDMEHRLENGEQLDPMELKWREAYEQDLAKMGVAREGGRLVYAPEIETPSASIDRPEERVTPTATPEKGNEGTSVAEDGHKVYHLGEEEQPTEQPTEKNPVEKEEEQPTSREERKEEQDNAAPVAGDEEHQTQAEGDSNLQEQEQSQENPEPQAQEEVHDSRYYFSQAMQEAIDEGELISKNDLEVNGPTTWNHETGEWETADGRFSGRTGEELERNMEWGAHKINELHVNIKSLNMQEADGHPLSEEEIKLRDDLIQQLNDKGFEYDEDGNLTRKDDYETSYKEQQNNGNEGATGTEMDADGMTRIRDGGTKLSYKIDENGEIEYGNNPKVKIDTDILKAVRSSEDNEGLSSRESMDIARTISQAEAVYGSLAGADRELTDGEKAFMENHNQNMEKLGLTHDENGNVVEAEEKSAKEVRREQREERREQRAMRRGGGRDD